MSSKTAGAPPGADERENPLARTSARMVAIAERWFPDAFLFVLIAVVVVAVAAIAHTHKPVDVSVAFGEGFWSLIPFTMQMALVAIGGYVVAMSPPAARVLRRLAAIPSTGRGAVAFVGVVSVGLSLVNWGISLIFSGLLVREMARRPDLRLDYRAAGAAGYLGLGFGFTLGISSSAAQLMANKESIPPSILGITGVVGFRETILTWQNLTILLVLTVVSLAICYFSCPSDSKARTAQDLGVELGDPTVPRGKPQRPGDRLEYSPVLTLLVVALAIGWLWRTFSSGNPLVTLSGLDTYNLIFFMAGLLLHWRPRSFMDAFAKSIPSVTGVVMQFPFYAGIGAIITKVANENGETLSDFLANTFVELSGGSVFLFAVVLGAYSAFLGFFIPSAGGKWAIEAPYVMGAAEDVHAHHGWTVMVYNIAETLPNFINPFWMLPLLGILRLRPKDLIGYTSIQFGVHFPIAILLGSALMLTF
ncbi:short-chain fatty acid transporter [Streptomyces sp. NPDC056669]|uniref:short-chain fatty acid transporter n=1 Tax=Streptomyces sp. NPDC056669 TaxID=3345903 RepID=UPI003676F8BC